MILNIACLDLHSNVEMLTILIVAIAVMSLVADCVGVLVNLIRLQLDLIKKHEDKENRQEH